MIQVDASEFHFQTDVESVGYLRAIVEHMMVAFGISREECIGRINNMWSHVDSVTGEFDPIYRENTAYWANYFVYGIDSRWWVGPSLRKRLGLPELKRLPYGE